MDVEGIPADLSGTYFRNGPGKFKEGDSQVAHELDGDGFILAISFKDGQVCVRHRLVQTQGLLRDKFAKRIFAKGFYGTPPGEGGSALDARKGFPKHTANAGMAFWEDQLLAIGTAGSKKPFQIDPACLGTVLGNEDEGSWNLDGALDSETGFGSCPKVCGTEGCLSFIDQAPSLGSTTVKYLEFAPGAWRPRYPKPREFSVGGFTRFADFAITPKWLVLAKPPLKADGLGAAFGNTFAEVLEFDPSGTAELIFATRLRRDEQEVTVPVDSLVCEEFANAFEDGGRVVVDLVAAERWDPGKVDAGPRWEVQDPTQAPKRSLVRYEVDLSSKTFTKRSLCDRHLGFTSVNPAYNGKKHRFVFAAVAHSDVGPYGGIAKIDVESGEIDEWLGGASEFFGEPLFVPKEGLDGEEDGYLISVSFDGQEDKSSVLIFDAKSISQGPVCQFPLQTAVPYGLKACWVPDLAYTPEEMKRKTTLLRMFVKKSTEWNAMEMGFSSFGGQALFQKQGVKMR